MSIILSSSYVLQFHPFLFHTVLSTIHHMKRSSRFLFIFLLLTPVFFFAAKTFVNAQAAPGTRTENNDAVSKQIQIEDEAAETSKSNLNKTAYDFGDSNISFWVTKIGGCVSEKCATSKYRADSGAIGGVGKMIAFTYSPPASVDVYVADLLHNMNLAQPAYAQGLGFSALQPILELWKVFRNIAYVFFVFIFLIIGFGIMFRKNLGGQTAVTVQQALPRIVIALLAVSFSYAIAGLMIDLMWVVMYFLIAMFRSAGLISVEFLRNEAILNENIFGIFFSMLTRGEIANRAGEIIGDFVTESLEFQGLAGAFAESGLSTVSSVLTTLIIFVAILFAMFRTFFSLIKVYLEIILTIIFAPLILMMGAINGNAFGNWLRGLVANLAVFPVLLVFMIIGFMLVDYQGSGDLSGSLSGQLGSGGFVPPFVPGRTNPASIGLIGGIAAIMLLPEVVGIVGKYKPASIFDDLASKAWKNTQAGEIGIPVATTALAGGGGAALGAGMALYNQGIRGSSGKKLRGRELFDVVKQAASTGYNKTDADGNVIATYGGLRNKAGQVRGYQFGQNVRKVIDDVQDQRLFEPDNTRELFERLAKREAPQKEDTKSKPNVPLSGQ